MEDLERMAIFARVVEEKSFSAAARRLNLSKSLVSKQITHLESMPNAQAGGVRQSEAEAHEFETGDVSGVVPLAISFHGSARRSRERKGSPHLSRRSVLRRRGGVELSLRRRWRHSGHEDVAFRFHDDVQAHAAEERGLKPRHFLRADHDQIGGNFVCVLANTAPAVLVHR